MLLDWLFLTQPAIGSLWVAESPGTVPGALSLGCGLETVTAVEMSACQPRTHHDPSVLLANNSLSIIAI